ncbi:EamA family transporter RarD [Pseudochrobactrum sp. HB0163]|uniref:EamA family transporter RarD n=1 Tax=Pseudochrobactrum sp. HB0163 TaxID=3450708 RepID=UPI003F6E2924
MSDRSQTGKPEAMRGFMFALFAYLFWGLFPFYMKAVAHIPVVEVLAHRVLWSLPVAAIILLFMGRTRDISAALRNPHTLLMACLTASLITVNWGVYVWAIFNDHALDAALGYYINPLVNVLLGAVFLKERLTKAQLLAVFLAAAAVVLLTVEQGGLPWVSIVLPLSFGFYGFFRKSLPIGPSQGFMLEVIILFIPACAYAIWLYWHGQDHFVAGTSADIMLLMLAGVVTAVPLIMYATGAKLLRYTTLGLMQYITPTMLFLIAVFAFREPFNMIQLYAFGLIWAGLIIYTGSILKEGRAEKNISVKAEASSM